MNDLFVRGLATPHRFVDGDRIFEHLLDAVKMADESLQDGDIVCVSSKAVAKCEGRVVPIGPTESDKIALVESQAKRILRRRGTLRITETEHGFVNANAGIDLSNTEEGTAVLLPRDPDKSARVIRGDAKRVLNIDIGVIISDTWGRTWRNGVTDVAIGSAGVVPILDLRGTLDDQGRPLIATEVAIVDELAGAAHLVARKNAGVPFVLIRGLDPEWLGEGSIADSVTRAPNGDLFR
jgi:coenzyme F420-0:L-glutamate ligase / coenzyme F420-1:gamma-L-glutamate ligase